jgi:hypothetical protein
MRAAVAIAGLLLLGGCMADTKAPDQPTMYLSMANGGATLDPQAAASIISLYRQNNGLGAVAVDPDLMKLAETQFGLARLAAPQGQYAQERCHKIGHRGDLCSKHQIQGVLDAHSCVNLEHDPDPQGRVSTKWTPVFRKRSCSNKKIAPDPPDKFGVILANIWLIDAVANCRHGTNVIAL